MTFVSAIASDENSITITEIAIAPTKSPALRPGSIAIGQEASTVVTVEARSGAASRRTALRTASRDLPLSTIRLRISSAMTIAASDQETRARLMSPSPTSGGWGCAMRCSTVYRDQSREWGSPQRRSNHAPPKMPASPKVFPEQEENKGDKKKTKEPADDEPDADEGGSRPVR